MTIKAPFLSTGTGILTLCGVVAAIVVSAAAVIFQQGSATLKRSADDQMALRLLSLKQGTDDSMSALLRRLEGLAAQPVMIRILDNDPDFEIAAALRAVVDERHLVIHAVVLNASGLVVASGGQMETEVAIRRAVTESKAAASKRAVIFLMGPYLGVVMPITWRFDVPERIGVLFAAIDASDVLANRVGWWTGLLDGSGNVVDQRGISLGTHIDIDRTDVTYDGAGRAIQHFVRLEFPQNVTAPTLLVGGAELYDSVYSPVNLLRTFLIWLTTGLSLSLVALIGTFTWHLYQLMARLTEARDQAIKASRAISSIYESVADVLFYLEVEKDGRYRFASINQAFVSTTGLEYSQVVGKRVDEVVPEPSLTLVLEKYGEAIREKRMVRWEETSEYPTGRLTSEVSIVPVLDDAGNCTHLVGAAHDITERLQLEAQYRQAQRMESVGLLASGIAHDFNNLLTVINGTSELLLAQVSHDNPMHADVQEITHAGERAAALTRQLLAFSRQQILEPRVLNVNAVVAGMESLLRRVLGEDIDLVVVPTPDLGHVKADPGQIEQVITNLAVNARDAMPQGGQLTIETQNVTLDEDDARQHDVAMLPGSYVRLAVSDSGVGMDEATRARIFEPFFTTKGPGKGTGLGLSTVYGIVKQSHGFIWVYSEVGRGTSFKIHLPRVTEAVDPDRPEPTVVSSSCTETILLVEDNLGLRTLATRFLEPAGYTVLSAATGEEALRLLERHDKPVHLPLSPVHLLLTDVVMPGMSGRQLAEQLAPSRPGMKVLYMSGYTNDTIVRHGVLDAEVAFLNKPFTATALLRKVREVLDS